MNDQPPQAAGSYAHASNEKRFLSIECPLKLKKHGIDREKGADEKAGREVDNKKKCKSQVYTLRHFYLASKIEKVSHSETLLSLPFTEKKRFYEENVKNEHDYNGGNRNK